MAFKGNRFIAATLLATAIGTTTVFGATLRQDQGTCVVDCAQAEQSDASQPVISPFDSTPSLFSPTDGALGHSITDKPDFLIKAPATNGLFSDDTTLQPNGGAVRNRIFETDSPSVFPE